MIVKPDGHVATFLGGFCFMGFPFIFEPDFARCLKDVVEVIQIHHIRIELPQLIDIGDHPLHDVQIAEELAVLNTLSKEVSGYVI